MFPALSYNAPECTAVRVRHNKWKGLVCVHVAALSCLVERKRIIGEMQHKREKTANFCSLP